MKASKLCLAKRKIEEVNVHLNVKKQKAKNREKIFCHLCNVECNSPDMLTTHCNGKKHKARELTKSRGSDKAEEKIEEEFYCEVCDVWCNSEVVMGTHLNGKKHKAREAEKDEIGGDPREREKGLLCEVCKVWCNSKAMMENHLKGKKHMAKEDVVRVREEEEEEEKEEVCDEKKDEDGDDPQGQISNNKGLWCEERKSMMQAKDLTGQEEEEEEEEKEKEKEKEKDEDLNVGCNVPQGQISNSKATMEAKENGSCMDLQDKKCGEEEEVKVKEEKKEFWCFTCKVKCDSQAMIAKHLKGSEHEEKATLRRGKSITGMGKKKEDKKE